MLHKLLLNPDISPDGVITGGGDKSPQPKIEEQIPQVEETPKVEDVPKEEEPTLVNVEDFDNLITPDSLKVKTEDKKEEPRVEEVKTEDKPAIKPALDKTAGRDYSGISEEHVAAFKKMSNEAFAAMKPIYQERQAAAVKLKEQEEVITKLKSNTLPDNYLENENGFVLDPEYRQAANNMQFSNYVLKHWKEQLRNIEEGKDWVDIDVNEKGEIIHSKPKAADSEARVNVLEYFQHALNQSNLVSQKLAGIKSNFVTKNKQMFTELAAQENQWFPAFSDEKHALQPVIAKVMLGLPAAFRGNPLARPLAKALVVLSVMSKEANKAPAKVEDKTKAKVGPTAADINGDSGKPASKGADVTIDEFEKFLG